MGYVGWGLTAIVVLALIGWLFRNFLAFGKEVHLERARELFKLQRERLHALFFDAAAATGKPRGLRWTHIDWDDSLEFLIEKQIGRITAFAGITIQFEAIPGGDMEGVAAVGNLRNATAVFFYEQGQWQTVGRVLFNMNPDEAGQHLHQQFETLKDFRASRTA